ncbi:MAG TPA: SUMF1/EgtB/PvdO family nonheme iron enzyme [Polyangiaceae bacterium]
MNRRNKAHMRFVALPILVAAALEWTEPAPADPSMVTATYGAACPREMVRVRGFCIDRWELSAVDIATGQGLSPYYPPLKPLLNRILDVWQVEKTSWGSSAAQAIEFPELSPVQQDGRFEVRAVAVPNVIPQAYLSRELARRACERAQKRLCTLAEWQTACRGERGTQFPYGSEYVAGRCNVWRPVHPAYALHGNSSLGHLDPRLNLVVDAATGPLLRATGTTPTCVSRFGDDAVYDMVGNLDEWVDDEPGLFVGGFYARATNKGCDAQVSNHAPSYYDYSTGARCCLTPGKT